MGDTQEEEHLKLPDHTQPSDYSDVHPKTYDPDYISQISSRMQVPDKISVGNEHDAKENTFINPEMPAATQFVGMTVPDRIVLAGDNQHLAYKQNLNLDLGPSPHASADGLSYVGLITPPRTLTLEERFPVVEETDDQKIMAAHGNDANRSLLTGNGHVGGPVPYDPGVNLHDSVLLNEENEATLLRTQVSKLTRRVQVIEQDNQKRANRELVLYPLILGYFLWKLLGWFTRDR